MPWRCPGAAALRVWTMTLTEQKGVSLLTSPVRRRIVDALDDAARASAAAGAERAGLSAAELAERVDLHVTTVRFHLDRLVAAGLVRTDVERDQSVGRPRKLYSVAQGSTLPLLGDTSPVLAELLSATFATFGDALERVSPADVGRRWAASRVTSDPHEQPARTPGTWLGKIGRMIDALHEWGYTAQVKTTDHGRTAQITITHCPLLAMARENPAVVCGIHRGMIAGAMVQLGEADTSTSLEPFVAPETCLAHVTTHTPLTPPGGGTP